LLDKILKREWNSDDTKGKEKVTEA